MLKQNNNTKLIIYVVFYKYAILKLWSAASVTEWSKVLRSGRSVFARVGSSPTACIYLFFVFPCGEEEDEIISDILLTRFL